MIPVMCLSHEIREEKGSNCKKEVCCFLSLHLTPVTWGGLEDLEIIKPGMSPYITRTLNPDSPTRWLSNRTWHPLGLPAWELILATWFLGEPWTQAGTKYCSCRKRKSVLDFVQALQVHHLFHRKELQEERSNEIKTGLIGRYCRKGGRVDEGREKIAQQKIWPSPKVLKRAPIHNPAWK